MQILSWGMGDLALWPGLEPRPPALAAWSLTLGLPGSPISVGIFNGSCMLAAAVASWASASRSSCCWALDNLCPTPSHSTQCFHYTELGGWWWTVAKSFCLLGCLVSRLWWMLSFFLFFPLFVEQWGMWDLSSLTRHQTGAPSRGSKSLFFFIVVAVVIHWHESAMGWHVFPIPIPPPTSLSTRSL